MNSNTRHASTDRTSPAHDPGAYASLAEAVRTQHVALLTQLLDDGLSPNAATSGSPSLLDLAMHLTTPDIALLLVERGAAVVPSPSGISLFEQAFSYSDYRPLCYALIRVGADVNRPHYDNGCALFNAICKDDIDLCRALIAAGADVTAEGPFGISPLRSTIEHAQHNSLELMRLLVQAGASTSALPLATNSSCLALTPFQYAVAYGFAKHVEFMIDEFGEDPYQVTLQRISLQVIPARGRCGLGERIVEAGTPMIDLAEHSDVLAVLYAATAGRTMDAVNNAIGASGQALVAARRPVRQSCAL
jgi:ankyrin repeat protein